MSDNPDEVAAILKQIKREILSQRLRNKPDQSDALATALAQVQLTSWVNPHQPIAWPNWPKGKWPKTVALTQKVIRRLLQWYINPIIEEQNQFNAAVEDVLNVLAQENAQLRAELRILSANPATESNRKNWI